jgi:hypothetical protein
MGAEPKLVGKDLVTLADAARLVAQSRLAEQDWSGMPLAVPGLQLVLEPRYKHQGLSQFRWSVCYDQNGVAIPLEPDAVNEAPGQAEYRLVNSWWNARYQATIRVYQDGQGRARCLAEAEQRLSFTLRTLQAAEVWPLEAEQKAQQKLASLIPKEQFELYMLTGHFSETSRRSQVMYVFRRGRPTIALREVGEQFHILCALCLHPIGYYGDTWAGVMCPTDEVIAHLLMMRGSEAKFWANANQHPLNQPSAGV